MNLVGNDELHSEEQLRTLWKESMKSVNCTTAHIAYDNFLLLMKGQTIEPEIPPPSARLSTLVSVPEGESVAGEQSDSAAKDEEESTSLPPRVSLLGEPEALFVGPKANDDGSMSSLPNITSPAMYESSSSTLGMSQSPGIESPSVSKVVSDVPGAGASFVPELADKRPPIITRGRSKSMADESESPDAHHESFVPAFRGDTRRALVLPERDPKITQELAKNQSALAVSRQLYRAHRQMRLSVMEASRRFEEEQARRARDTLMAQKAKEAGMMGLGQAGLVMRHGHKVQVTTDAIREYLDNYRAEQQQLVDKATRRGGRGKGNRKKTISDMSAMMNPSLGQDDLADIVAKAARTPEAAKDIMNASLNDIGMPDLKRAIPTTGRGRRSENGVAPPNVSIVTTVDAGPSVHVSSGKTIRKATVPGEFHQTKDPFSSDGMYGGARIGLVDVNQIKSSAKPKS